MPDAPTYPIHSLIAEVQKRIHVIEEVGYLPWRVELGDDWSIQYGTPTMICGLPVEIVPVSSYLRVAYRESWAEPPPIRESNRA